MPYIDKERKAELEPGIVLLKEHMDLLSTKYGHLKLPVSLQKGDLTYIVYALALHYITLKGSSYQNISDSKAALQDASDEIHDRVLRLYENRKMIQNGDVE